MSGLAEFAALAACYYDGEVVQLAAEILLSGFGGEKEVFDSEESPSDVHAVNVLPRL